MSACPSDLEHVVDHIFTRHMDRVGLCLRHMPPRSQMGGESRLKQHCRHCSQHLGGPFGRYAVAFELNMGGKRSNRDLAFAKGIAPASSPRRSPLSLRF